jgi:hypothetical protein
MIVTEHYMTRSDGVVLVRTYSDAGMMIERDGVRYSEAVDPEELGRTYTETDEPIEAGADPTLATEADYQSALRNMGVEV